MSDRRGQSGTALRLLDRAFDLIFEFGPLAIARVDRDYKIERANARYCELTGYSAEELRDMTAGDLAHPDDLPLLIELAQQGFVGEIPHFSADKRFLTKSGDVVWTHMTVTFLPGDGGERASAIALVQDITERKEADERIRALNAELEARVAELEASNEALGRANKELETFSSNVSHDLKGPLVSIAQFSQVLLDGQAGELDRTQSEMLQRVRNAGLQAKHIIDDLRDLADVTRREIFAEDVDLSALAWQVIDDVRITAPERDVSFDVRPDLRVYGDPALVRLLLTNLIQNAWKYTSPRKNATIEIGVEESQLRTVHFVRDDGIGFDNADRERIFEAFERLRPDEFVGTGLGLATAKRIITRHGGDIWAEGESDGGATFYFSLK